MTSPIQVGLSGDGTRVELTLAGEAVSLTPRIAKDLGEILMTVADATRRRAEQNNPSLSIPPPSPGDI